MTKAGNTKDWVCVNLPGLQEHVQALVEHQGFGIVIADLMTFRGHRGGRHGRSPLPTFSWLGRGGPRSTTITRREHGADAGSN